MKFKFLNAVFASVVLSVSSIGNAALIYEQDISNVATGHDPFTYKFAYDDFTLNANYSIDTITVNAFANVGFSDNIGNMDWEIRSVVGSIPGSILYSGNISAVVKTDTGLDFSGWDLVDYTIDIANINLPSGSYFLGLKANLAENVHITLINDPVNISQALVANDTGYSSYWHGKDFAFRLEGVATSVPEPVSLVLFGLGLAGVRFSRKRNKV